MVLAISRFKVANALRDDVEEAFLKRPGLVDSSPGFIGLEVFTDVSDSTVFHLLTRWTDVESFRQWHSSSAHQLSHRGIPTGLKLDPAFTELVFWKRVGHEVEAGAYESVADWLPLLSEFLSTCEAVSFVVAATDGAVQACSAGMASALQVEPEGLIGRSIFEFMAEPSRAAVANELASGRRRLRECTLLNFQTATGERFTLECRLDVQPKTFAIVGAAPRQQSRAYTEALEDLNNRLAVEVRESARKQKELERVNRKLEETLRELDTAYWHLRKIQEVLPICLECGKVKTGEGSWQTVVDYLRANSQFLSHGYCPECYHRAVRSMGNA
jgi:heme oxygenase (mycobilin-producing)